MPKGFLQKNYVVIIIIILFMITLLTKYQGSTDISDYSDIAKYFAGDYSAKVRSSHSYLYGAMHFPFIKMFHNFSSFKISSFIFLLAIIFSVYIATRNKKAFLLMLLSPIVWYMAPWINSIQLSSLLFFWGYYAIKRYEITEKVKFLFLSGLLIGLSWAFWDAIIFFFVFIAISFFYNRKFYQLIMFLAFVFVGLLPKLIFDGIFLGFAFSGIIRYTMGHFAAILFGGVYGTMQASGILVIIPLIFFIPYFSYRLFSHENWCKDKKSLVFLALSFLLILKNAQPRYMLLLIPILIFELAPKIKESEFRNQMIISIVISIIVICPYLVQIKYSTNTPEFSSLILTFNNIQIYQNQQYLILKDLENITQEFPDRTFIVGNNPDDFQVLAHLYWGKSVKEFVSIQDYQLWSENSTVIFQKIFSPVPKISDRRQIWIGGGISKTENDNTDYKSITLGIGLNEPLNFSSFHIIKKYNILYLSEK